MLRLLSVQSAGFVIMMVGPAVYSGKELQEARDTKARDILKHAIVGPLR